MRRFVCVGDFLNTGRARLNPWTLGLPISWNGKTHPDMKRQRSRRLRSLTLDGCRALKTAHQGSSWMPKLPDLFSKELFPTEMPRLYAWFGVMSDRSY